MRVFCLLSFFVVVITTTFLLLLPADVSEAKGKIDWQAIADAKSPTLPKAQDKVVWRDDLRKALAEADKSGRPLFVTIRCLPCKQCSDFDKDVLEGGKLLDPLLRQFITVRLTTMEGIDERILPFREYQDMDLSWWGYFLSDHAALYGVYGGMDSKGDGTRISPQGLASTMKRVLDHHYQADRKEWAIDRDAPMFKKGKAQTPNKLKGYRSWTKGNAGKHFLKGKKEKNDCLHCHWVNDIVRQPEIDAKRFDKTKDFFVWPYPENLGFTLKRDHGLEVKSIETKSAAAKSELKVGDELLAMNDHRLFSEADFRAQLNKAPHKETKIYFEVLRKGKVQKITIGVKDGWRKSDLGWRKSVNEAQLGAHFGFSWPLKTSDNERKKRGIKKGTMAVKPWIPNKPGPKNLPAVKAGLRGNDIITAVNGESPDVTQRAFGVFFRLKFEPGDKVVYTVVNPQGKSRKITFTAE